MATHEINMTIPPEIVLNKDVEFAISSDGSKIGTLKISRGTVEWLPANHKYGYHVSWEDFDKMMREKGTRH